MRRNDRRSPLCAWRARHPPGGLCELSKSADISDLIHLAVVRACRSLDVEVLRKKEDNLLQNPGKHTLDKHDELHLGEVLHEKTTHLGGVVDGQQFRRQHQAQATTATEEKGAMDRERSPGRR